MEVQLSILFSLMFQHRFGNSAQNPRRKSDQVKMENKIYDPNDTCIAYTLYGDLGEKLLGFNFPLLTSKDCWVLESRV
jgi:hypothetical protein